MAIQGAILEPMEMPCPYIEGLQSINENIFVLNIDDEDMDRLLQQGYRHFGSIFFRPMCGHCNSCISIRIPVKEFTQTKSVKRLYNKNKHLKVSLETPMPDPSLFELYKKHKTRFNMPAEEMEESYENYLQSFFFPFPFNRMLMIRDGERVVSVSHLDVTEHSISAVYCYHDSDYARFSPGKFSVYKEIEMAQELGIDFLYLGYYIPQNRHSRYKIDFKPNQLMTVDGQWVDYLDAAGNIVTPFFS